MDKKVRDEVISRVKHSKYYFISLDSTPDESHVDQLIPVLRYIDNDAPVAFVTFVTFRCIHGEKGAQSRSDV